MPYNFSHIKLPGEGRNIDMIMAQIYRELHEAASGYLNKIEYNSRKLDPRGEPVIVPIAYVRAARGFRNNAPPQILAALPQENRRINNANHKVLERYTEVAEDSLMMLCMLSFSNEFRIVCTRASQHEFEGMLGRIRSNFESIEYFAKSRGLNWMNLLCIDREFQRSLEKRPDLVRESLGPVPEEHPHTRVVPNDSGVLLIPSYKGRDMINIPSNIYRGDMFSRPIHPRPKVWPEEWKYPCDPTIRTMGQKCINCGSRRFCDCDPLSCQVVVRPLVELRHYGGKGVGIRTLQDIRKGAILEEYVGEIIPTGAAYGNDFTYDEDYGFGLDVSPRNAPGDLVLADISSQQFGNWTRFLNHACNPCLTSESMTLGPRLRIMIIADRDIGAFEELTLDYGDGYWEHRYCLCFGDSCRFPPP